MIGFLTGKIISKKPTKILLDVNGVGYLINISINTFDKLSDERETISLYTYLSVKEDALDLYGFFTAAEKEMFELLISISGIGPKLAQSILSGIQIDELRQAISEENVSRVIAVPGIGRKTAERLMIELRDKVEKLSETFESQPGVSFGVRSDAVAALANLGYNQKAADKAVRNVLQLNPSASIEELIKEALGELNR
ncbi:MAG: Holliday junction branch migration protein RuvA [Melioribacteraceae bacterium]|nr:Holliday junction branch migration protein RuvA [Melioribacteraceae bacterium]MCF8356772.1 Holliday junction branch migration protein RuvA [Melioribacteraceae bacterium]MCF8396134.1 Holliday junction branch migration protein RuvA [Melioribacteraceae bacterium]MCF8421100.1 Holliday junction branch migration protein RuvA [Melioribacteraceae bacterium]